MALGSSGSRPPCSPRSPVPLHSPQLLLLSLKLAVQKLWGDLGFGAGLKMWTREASVRLLSGVWEW